MSFWVLCLLCIVQGLTEFLPVSSSGHLTFIQQVFGVEGNLLFLNLFLHLATLVAVVIVYRKIIFKLIKKPFQPLTYKLLIATIFTCVIAFVYEYFKLYNYTYKIYCFGFLATSILLFLLNFLQKRTISIKTTSISFKDSVMVGVVQGLAIVPGLSRSGSTIATLSFCGNERDDSAEFSFLLSIPIIVGGFILELFKMVKNPIILNNITIETAVFAFFFTLIIAILSLKLTIKILKKNRLIIFSIYTFIMFVVTFTINYII